MSADATGARELRVLEGRKLVAVDTGWTDTACSTSLHVPSQGLIVAGDDTTGVISRHLFAYGPQTGTLTHLRDTSSVYGDDPILFDSGHLLFQSYDPVTGEEPWISDGTPSGTHLLQNVAPEASTNDSNPNSFVNFGGLLAFAADDGVTGAELWASDGTAAGTKELADIDPGSDASSPGHLTVMNGALYFLAYDQTASHLMKIASPGAAPQVLADLTPIPPASQYYTPPCAQDRTAVMNGSVYFVAQQNGTSGYELWKTDGSAGGTVALTSLSAANPFSVPCYVTTVGNRVYFTTTTVSTGNELWVTDGTPSGTVQVADLVPGAGSSSPYLAPTPLVLNGLYYFAAANNLWQTDGTSAGTVMALSYATLTGDANASGSPMALLNGKLLLQVFAPSISMSPQLWVSDGTVAGSTPLSTPAVNYYIGVTVIGSKAYFAAQDSANGSEPWVTDGTPAGTFMLKDTDPAQNSSPSWYTNFNGVTVFEVDGASQRYELWQTDGTSAGTKFIATIGAPPSSTVAAVRPQLVIGQNLYFSAASTATGVELFTLPNNAPVASADNATSSNDAAVTINVVANDTDSDGAINPTSVQITTNPTHGTAVVQSDGSIVYTPAAGYSGTDAFAYTVADNQGAVSAPAQVTVTVTASVTVTGTGTGTGTGSGGGGKGGGGAVGLLDLAILLFFLGMRALPPRIRYRFARASR
jgi:ELWxxDGT repeat protein